MRYDYADRATLCHPFTTPTTLRRPRQPNFAFFLFFQNRIPITILPVPLRIGLASRPAFSLFSFSIIFTKRNFTPLLPSLLSLPRNSTLCKRSKERSLVSKKFLKNLHFREKLEINERGRGRKGLIFHYVLWNRSKYKTRRSIFLLPQ